VFLDITLWKLIRLCFTPIRRQRWKLISSGKNMLITLNIGRIECWRLVRLDFWFLRTNNCTVLKCKRSTLFLDNLCNLFFQLLVHIFKMRLDFLFLSMCIFFLHKIVHHLLTLLRQPSLLLIPLFSCLTQFVI
jgi:hypothetical protein